MYRVDANNVITRIDGMEIKRDITSADYQQYLHWALHKQYVGPPIFVPVENMTQEEIDAAPKVSDGATS